MTRKQAITRLIVVNPTVNPSELGDLIQRKFSWILLAKDGQGSWDVATGRYYPA